MPSYAFFQKQIVPLSEAKIGIMTHALHYGTAIFEGIRGNWNSQQEQIFVFRIRDHYQRLHNGCRVLKIEPSYSVEDMCRITIELVEKCDFREDIYIRPLAYKSAEVLGLGLNGIEGDFLILVIPWGKYLDVDKARCSVSTWRRPEDNAIPPQIKTSGIYVNNSLAKSEVVENGFDEAIMLTPDGHVSEGTGENIFLIINGKLITPGVSDSILAGITRDSVIKLAKRELGIETIERSIDRSELYTADECFLVGTAAHLTPVAEIDRHKIGDGEIGEITKKLQKLFFEVIRGSNSKYIDWCTPVYKK
jgi:branched-chain amino acid aminotransferase